MGRDVVGGDIVRRRTRTYLVAGAGAAALTLALVAGCGLGPFAPDGGADDSSALASAGPAVSAPGPTTAESPLLDEKLDPNSAVGMLAPGFPTDLLPVPAGAQVLVSSVDPIADSDAYQVSLNLRTTLDADGVVDLYRQSLLNAGFTEAEQTAQTSALAAQSTFTRSAGDELLVIGVLDRDDLRTVTIGGRLRSTG